MTSSVLTTSRIALIRRAFTLEWFTIAWMTIEAGVAIVSGLGAHSITLLAFGIDSLIEIASALVLVWRLTVELRRGAAFPEAVEERASKIGGTLLFALAGYVAVSAASSLLGHRGSEFSPVGLALSVVAIPAMLVLSRAKLRVADALGSRALRADAMEAVTCGYLSLVVVVGLLAQLIFHASWVDGATSLPIIYLLIKEGREAWIGDDCCG